MLDRDLDSEPILPVGTDEMMEIVSELGITLFQYGDDHVFYKIPYISASKWMLLYPHIKHYMSPCFNNIFEKGYEIFNNRSDNG